VEPQFEGSFADYRPGDVQLCAGPAYHSAPLLFDLRWPLASGVPIVLVDKWDTREVLRAIEQHRVTHAHMVPTMFQRLLALPQAERERYDVSSLRLVIHGAAPCPVHVKQALIDWIGPVLIEYYAATEGGDNIHVNSADWLRRPGTVGRLDPSRGHRILDEQGNDVPVGSVGRIYFRAPAEDRFEYFGDPAKTAAAYAGDRFTLGDLGYVDEEGWLFLTGRSAETIISGGVNIYPRESRRRAERAPCRGAGLHGRCPRPRVGRTRCFRRRTGCWPCANAGTGGPTHRARRHTTRGLQAAARNRLRTGAAAQRHRQAVARRGAATLLGRPRQGTLNMLSPDNPILGINHVGIVAHDQAALQNFYARAAGLQPWSALDALGLPGGGVALAGPNAGVRLLPGASSPRRRHVSEAGFTHLCFQSPAITPLHAAFAEAGATFHSPLVDLGTGFLYCYARDPEHNVTELEGVAPVWTSPSRGSRMSTWPAPTCVRNAASTATCWAIRPHAARTWPTMSGSTASPRSMPWRCAWRGCRPATCRSSSSTTARRRRLPPHRSAHVVRQVPMGMPTSPSR
jgi:catechol 2,3-dioxygenase-like lactoylglutathione lyase family enzyme